MNGSGNGLFLFCGTEVKLEITSGQPFPLPDAAVLVSEQGFTVPSL